MSRFRTALGEEFLLERRLGPIGWRPRLRGDTVDASWIDVPDVSDAFGILAVIGFALLAIVLALVVVPLLLFVAEVAFVVALVIPLTILALVVGLKRHALVLTRVRDGRVVAERQVRGVPGSVCAARALKAAAKDGAFRTA